LAVFSESESGQFSATRCQDRARAGHGRFSKAQAAQFCRYAKDKQPLFEIYVKEKVILNHQQKRAYGGIGREDLLAGDDKKRKGARCGGRCAAVDVPQLL
jgi:hypothetical protein